MFDIKSMSVRFAAVSIAFIVAIGNVGSAEALKSKGKYAGIELYTSAPKHGVKYDEDVTPPGAALKKIKAAIDLIYLKSSFSSGKIDFLKKQGRVVMVYDPHLPDPDQASGGMLLAIFLPSYLRDGDTKGSGSKKDFLVVVSRVGILWELKFLASVIVHELVGHGVQHQRGRIDTMRELDIECEAWLYQERSLQDFSIDKFSKQMGQFRTQLEDRECSEFRQHQARKYPSAYKLWDETNPDVPRLLTNFDKYLGDIRNTTTKSALKFRGSEKDGNLAKKFAGNNAEAIFNVAKLYTHGVGIEQSGAKALRWYRRAAELGHAKAQHRTAIGYFKGRGVAKDIPAAIRWYEKAANNGIVNARAKLGNIYTFGEGVPQNYKKAIKWLALASADGVASAQYNYGVILEYGYTGKADLVTAKYWYQMAANQGNADAQNNLGAFFRWAKGGVKKDYKKAAKLFRAARDGGNSLGAANLARLYRYGQGVKKDPKRAVELYKEAVNQKVTFAYYELGELYRRGLGVKKDFKRARSLFQQGANKGGKFAKIGLAKLYTRGQGGLKKLDEGLSILRKLGNGPSAKAQLALAKIYWNGRVVPKDLKKAEKWYRKAADRESRTGMAALGFMYLRGKGVKRDYKEAANWLQKAATKNHRNAQYLLGTLYNNGNGVSKDPALALSWFKKAASRGHKKAKKRLNK